MTSRTPRPAATLAVAAALSLAATGAAGCRSDMYDQPKYEPLEASEFYSNGTSARIPPSGTVPRLDPRADPTEQLYEPSRVGGEFVDASPFPIDRDGLVRGQTRFRIYCTPCHGQLGDGNGMIVERGFSPPPSFHDPLIRDKSLGHYYDVITNGHGAMYSYASRVAPRDRWLVAGYIRVLQKSQAAPVEELSPEDRQRLDQIAASAVESESESESVAGRASQ